MAKPLNLFEDLRRRVITANTKMPAENRAKFWYRQHAAKLSAWSHKYEHITFDKLAHEQFSKQLVTPVGSFPGSFYFFRYDAKTKEDLPYWDQFPFTLVLQREKDGFLGLNFHYLDYDLRARLFDALYPFREGRTATPNIRDLRMRLKISYELLQSHHRFSPFRPCLKRYLSGHVKSPLLKVSAKEWDIALFLPVERFVKEDKAYVWKRSRGLAK
jgi:hypothetical protein